MSRKKKDAIQTDVSGEEHVETSGVQGEDKQEDQDVDKKEDDEPVPIIDERAEAMERIYENRAKELEEETGVSHSEEEEGEEEESDPEVKKEGEEEKAEGEEKEETPQEEEEMITITVEGQQKQIPLSKVKEYGVRAAQKIETGDKRLEAASKKAKELEQREAQLAEREQALSSKDTQTDKKESEQVNVSKEELGKAWEDLIEAIDYGSKEEQRQAREHYDDLLAKQVKASTPAESTQTQNQAPAGLPQDFSSRVRTEVRHMNILDKVNSPPEEGGFGDMTGSPVLGDRFRNMVADRVDEKFSTGAQDEWATYRDACQEVKDEILEQISGITGLTKKESSAEKSEKTDTGKKNVVVNKDDLEKRRLRKKRIDQLPSAGAKQETETKVEKELSVQETIAEMDRKRRAGAASYRKK